MSLLAEPWAQSHERLTLCSLGSTPLFAATTPSTRIRTYSERIHFSPEYATEYAYSLAYPRVFRM
eukprot:scaffold49709_cov60-Phaeocystis_antarctica.AAC.2